MGNLNVKGTASMDFEVDLFEVTINIMAFGHSSGDVISIGKKNTENVLMLIKEKLGIEPGEIILKDDSVDHSGGHYNEQNITYMYNKSVLISINANLPLFTRLTKLLSDLSDVEYRMELKISDICEKEKLVIETAINDSRQKAEMIASSLGQKIIGADEITYDTPSLSNYKMKRSAPNVSCSDLESELKLPTKNITKSIDINWKIE